MNSTPLRFLTLLLLFCFGSLCALAADQPADRDAETGVVVAPGAMTWSSDNFDSKKQLITDVAASHGRTCTDRYTFLGWAIGHGGPDAIIRATRDSYEKAGYSIEQKPGSIETDNIWIARSGAREAVILWSPVAGSTIYLSCITTGGAPADSGPPRYLGILLAVALVSALLGWWLVRRRREPTSPPV